MDMTAFGASEGPSLQVIGGFHVGQKHALV